MHGRMAFFDDFKRAVAIVLKPPERFPEPREVRRAASKLAEEFDGELQKPRSVDLERLTRKVWALWQGERAKGLAKLDYRELKYAPWVFYFKKPRPVAEDVELTAALLDVLAQKCRAAFTRLPYVYLLGCDPALAGTEKLRRTAHDFLVSYAGKRSQIQQWKEALVFLFAPQGPRNTARWLIEQGGDPVGALGTLGVSGQLLAGEFVRQVAREVVATAAQSFPANLGLSLKLLVDESGRVRFQDVLCEAASLWIPKADEYGSGEIRNRLQRFFLKYLGDPRWPGERMKWDRVSEEARRIITRWLAREDITFFFDVLSQTVEHHAWEYRREFWEAYLPHIDATWVILSPDVEAVMGKQVEERIASGACGEFKGSNQGRSMLAIEMKGWVFVEWTHSGSCRGWPKQEFPLALGKRGYRINEVDSILPTCAYRLRHYGSENYRWQTEFSLWLNRTLGLPMELFKR